MKGIRKKRMDGRTLKIIAALREKRETQSEISRRFKVSRQHVHNIAQGLSAVGEEIYVFGNGRPVKGTVGNG